MLQLTTVFLQSDTFEGTIYFAGDGRYLLLGHAVSLLALSLPLIVTEAKQSHGVEACGKCCAGGRGGDAEQVPVVSVIMLLSIASPPHPICSPYPTL